MWKLDDVIFLERLTLVIALIFRCKFWFKKEISCDFPYSLRAVILLSAILSGCRVKHKASAGLLNIR